MTPKNKRGSTRDRLRRLLGFGQELWVIFVVGQVMSGYIPRGQDIEGLIRENQQLRTANKALKRATAKLMESCLEVMTKILPTHSLLIKNETPFHTNVLLFSSELTQLGQSLQSLPLKLQESSRQRQSKLILQFQQKIQQNQATINELNLIIQRLQLEAADRETEKEHLRLLLAKERLLREEVEKSEQKWRGRFGVLNEELNQQRINYMEASEHSFSRSNANPHDQS